MEFEKVDREFIESFIKKRGISINKLCMKTGIAPAGMYRYLKGERELSNPGKAAIYYFSLTDIDPEEIRNQIKKDLISKLK